MTINSKKIKKCSVSGLSVQSQRAITIIVDFLRRTREWEETGYVQYTMHTFIAQASRKENNFFPLGKQIEQDNM